MGPFTAFMSVDHAAVATTADVHSGDKPKSWLSGVIANFRRGLAESRMRDQLAQMDDAMLRDIGIASDEIHKIRARESFTPRDWTDRRLGRSRRVF